MEDDHRAYREAIASAIRILRPHAEVSTVGLDTLAEEVARLVPYVVICTEPAAADQGDVPAWVQLSLDPTRPTSIRLFGDYSEKTNPTLEALLTVIDEARQLLHVDAGDR